MDYGRIIQARVIDTMISSNDEINILKHIVLTWLRKREHCYYNYLNAKAAFEFLLSINFVHTSDLEVANKLPHEERSP